MRFAIIAVALALGASAAGAQEPYTYTLSLAGGFGAAYDIRPKNTDFVGAIQAGASMVIDEDTLLALRVGRVHFGASNTFAPFSKVDLDYGLIGGEYRFKQSYYDFGFFGGLGAYQLTGRDLGGARRRVHTAPGVGFGIDGDFDLTRHLSAIVEFSAHYALLDEADVFPMAFAGLAFHF